MKTVTEKEIKEQYQDLFEFKYEHTLYYRDNNLRKKLNSMLGCKLKAVYSSNMEDYKFDHGIDWSGEYWILVTETGNVISMTNSEWSFIKEL